MASKLITGPNYFVSYSDGEGGGATSFFDYSPNLDINFASIQASVNGLVDEVRGVQGPNQVLPADILTLDDPNGVGATLNTLVGTDSYAPDWVSVTRVDVTKGVALVAGLRVEATSGVQLAPLTGTDDGGTLYNTIALDSNGAITNNSAPGAQALDLWRVEVDATPEFVGPSPGNIEKVGTWQYVIDGDAWVEMCDATGLGTAVTFPIEPSGLPAGRPYAEPKHRVNRIERVLSGLQTDLQTVAETVDGSGPQTIGPIVIPGGTAATPGLILGDGTGTAETGMGFFRIGANRLGIATSGALAVEVDAAGQLDLPLNFRVKGRRTAAQTIAHAGGLVPIVFSAADDFDIGTWHAADANFTVPTDGGGTYVITAAIEWAEAITNIRDIVAEIQLGGTLITGGKASARLEVGEDHASTITVVSVLAAGNVVTVEVSQDDTVGALGLDVIDATLSIVKVA